jgi:hypothetical protein
MNGMEGGTKVAAPRGILPVSTKLNSISASLGVQSPEMVISTETLVDTEPPAVNV